MIDMFYNLGAVAIGMLVGAFVVLGLLIAASASDDYSPWEWKDKDE